MEISGHTEPLQLKIEDFSSPNLPAMTKFENQDSKIGQAKFYIGMQGVNCEYIVHVIGILVISDSQYMGLN